ncbi:AAA family ATPase [Mesorhizobium abyssinicae]|uniref:AAA family ATPase n=1 Tax=Mesorhizobium abyssinicae TaxID=1209958 RepID=UPI00339A254C
MKYAFHTFGGPKMPIIQDFRITNFKGAKDVTVSFGATGDRKVITLIGLNESGKTTILEGISQFTTRDEIVTKFFDVDNKTRFNSFIPVDRKAAFSESIVIQASVLLDDADVSAISDLFKSNGLILDKDAVKRQFHIERRYTYKDSEYSPEEFINYWMKFNFMVKKSHKAKKYEQYIRPDRKSGLTDVWYLATVYVSSKLPNIVYFPTFLVDVPSKIYLLEHDGETPQNRYYRVILQNVLDSMGEGISIERHVVERITKYKESNPVALWFSILLGDPTRRNIDSVFLKISTAITKEVLGSWSKIFNRPVSAKRIEVNWSIDTGKDEIPYASISVSDGESPYALSERSLGFRWFFSFLLFTRFGGSNNRPNLFLFDEPAANLHAKAQAELLQSFSKIVQAGNIIIYSTHSHHMINPIWLSGAYIVNNEAIDYEGDLGGADFSVLPTLITATSYRRFVGENGSRVSYFQPVLEKLMYLEPAIAASGPQILVEGPSDFYALEYARKRHFPELDITIVPGGGAGHLDPLISIAMSRGYPFVILLDGDEEGRKSRQRYIEKWTLREKDVLLLSDIFPTIKNCEIEKLVSEVDRSAIKSTFGSSGKKQLQLHLAEIHYKDGDSLDGATVEKFRLIIERCLEKLQS